MAESRIKMFFNCRQCVEELPPGQSPETWARINVGFTADQSIQVWCIRHDKEIVEVPVVPPTTMRCEHCDE